MQYLRTHLALKVFLSNVIVILVGVIVLATATSLSAPVAFNRHLAGMSQMMTGNSMMGNANSIELELFSNFQASIVEALSLATIAALLAAILTSYFISRQIVIPIQRMKALSQRIAEGEYNERLGITGDLQKNQVDELDQLALSFNQMADKLQKTETMRIQLIGDVSHELRTPLSAIKGYMEGLIDGVMPATPETYHQVHTEADRLQRLVNDLQELSRVEAGSYQLDPKPVSPNQLIDIVVNHLNRQFEEKGVQLEKHLDVDLPVVSADKDRMLQVITNLLGNALQYTPTGGGVIISAAREKSEICVTISDTGLGISPEHLPFIFNRFYRTDKSRARASGGSGIGLTIAQAIVKAHHGRIWVESAGEGKGSSFHFTLPVVA